MTSLRSDLTYQPPSTTTRHSRPSELEVLRLSELQEQTSALDLANHNLLLFLTCLDKDCRRRAGGLYLNQWGETPCLTNNVLPKMTHTHPLTLFLNILIPSFFSSFFILSTSLYFVYASDQKPVWSLAGEMTCSTTKGYVSFSETYHVSKQDTHKNQSNTCEYKRAEEKCNVHCCTI